MKTMPDQYGHDDYLALIAKYLSQNTTAEEQTALEEWVAARPENRATFLSHKRSWQAAAKTEKVDVAQNWEVVEKTLFKEAKVIPMKSNRRRWISIAAAIAVLFVCGFLYFQQSSSPERILYAAFDEVNTITLSDGTIVTLNHNSSIQGELTKTSRTIQLSGDAFFEVERNENTPFVVKTEEMEVEVLGTSFYVDAKSQKKEKRVIVEEGKVAVRADNQSVELTKGQSVIFDLDTRLLEKSNNDDPNFLAFKTQTFVFEGNSLSQVAVTLSQHFEVDITFADAALGECPIDATFRQKSLDAIIKIIASSFDLIVEQTNDSIVLSGSCD